MKFLLWLLFFLFTLNIAAQKFKPDSKGYISDPSFRKYCDEHNYQLIGMFDSLPGKKKGMAARIIKNGNWIYVDLNGKEFENHDELAKYYGNYIDRPVDPYDRMDNFEGAMPLPENMQPPKFTGEFRKGTKYGYKINDRIVVQPVYDDVDQLYSDDFLLFKVRTGDLNGVCDYQGKLMIPVKYTDIEVIQSSAQCFFRAKKDGKTGIMSRGGKITIPFEFERIEITYPSQMLLTTRNSLMGAYTKTGIQIVPPIYELLSKPVNGSEKSGFIARNEDLKYGYLNQSGKVIVPLQYNSLNYDEGNFLTYGNNKFIGAIDTTGKVLFDPIYQSIEKPKGANCYIVKKVVEGKNQIGIYDIHGNAIGEPSFVNYLQFGASNSEAELYLFSKDNHSEETGVFNVKTLKWAFPCEYKIHERSVDFMIVSKSDPDGNHLKGVFDSSGKFLIPVRYNELEYSHTEKTAVVRLKGKYGVVGANDKIILPFVYDTLNSIRKSRYSAGAITRLTQGHYIFSENSGFGIVNSSGVVTIKPEYDKIHPTAAGLMCISGDTISVFSPEGKQFFSTTQRLTYKSEGYFEGRNTSGLTGFDLYKNQTNLRNRPVSPYIFVDPPQPPKPVDDVDDPDKIYEPYELEEMPSFIGGMTELRAWISKNLVYPENAQELGLEGKSYISFVVEKDGSISNVKIIKKFQDCPACDKEAINLAKRMPRWNPGRVNGKNVRSKFNLPLIFKL